MPRRKPASARQNRETKDIGLARIHARLVPPPPHPAKGKLLAQTVKDWDTFWASDVAGTVIDADLVALRRLFQMYDARERAVRAWLAAPFTLGSTKQLQNHPAASVVASMDTRITKLEDRFGITPLGRLKLGIVLGAAAKSLEDMNRDFSDEDDDDESSIDPRLAQVIDITDHDDTG